MIPGGCAHVTAISRIPASWPLRTPLAAAVLAGHTLRRLATIGPDGAPTQVHPVALWLNADTGTIDIGGPVLTRSQKFRNVQADPRVSLVVDDQAETPNPIGQTGRGIEIRRQAEIVTLDPPLIAAFSRGDAPHPPAQDRRLEHRRVRASSDRQAAAHAGLQLPRRIPVRIRLPEVPCLCCQSRPSRGYAAACPAERLRS
jgi:PPOX class F420-dependent enzyme/OxyR family protein